MPLVRKGTQHTQANQSPLLQQTVQKTPRSMEPPHHPSTPNRRNKTTQLTLSEGTPCHSTHTSTNDAEENPRSHATYRSANTAA
jgi:hypothetical protein